MALGIYIYIRCDPDKPSSLLKLAINVRLNSRATVSLYQMQNCDCYSCSKRKEE